VALILSKHKVSRYMHVQRTVREAHEFKQARRGRPGLTHHSYDIEWKFDQAAINFDHKSDRIFPLLTNDRNLSPAEVLQAYKRTADYREALRAAQNCARNTTGIP
jgi:hypothetical protein